MNKIERIKELTKQLNKYRDAYYNNSESLVSDYEYDCLFDELQNLEKSTGTIMSNSPTHTVGFKVMSYLKKVEHNHPMLSLDKTKSTDDLVDFMDGKDSILMLKMDGLTISLRYLDGKLVSAETRGNGEIGEDILHNAKVFKNIPLGIAYKDELILDGEAVITIKSFNEINDKLSEENKYKNPRNLVSGSVRQLDSEIASARNIEFIAWKCVKGFDNSNDFANKLICVNELGFDVVPFEKIGRNCTKQELEYHISKLKEEAEDLGYPIDGMVLSYNDVKYGESLGMTGHHVKSQIAYKFYDEEVVTTLKEIEWSMGKTGALTPVAIFDPVEIEGTTVSRASLHNVSIVKELELGIGDEITVYKANEIIPQVRDNLARSNTVAIPKTCPVCGKGTEIVKDNDTEVLMCVNPYCETKLVKRLVHFVSRKGMDIAGLSEETLSKFVELGWITNLFDIYGSLQLHYSELMSMSGFGKRSVEKLDAAIEKSKDVELKNFIAALSIPGIGTSQSKELAKKFTWDEFQEAGFGNYDFSKLDGFGEVLNRNIHEWFKTMWDEDQIGQLVRNLQIKNNKPVNENSSNVLSGMVFVITGSLNQFTNRDEAKEWIEALGGKVSGTVSSKTSYLVNNDVSSESGKNKKAKNLGIPIISESQLLEIAQ